MRFVVEGAEEAIRLADKAVKLANELRETVDKIAYGRLTLADVKVTEETDPAAATTEPEKND